MMHRLIPFMICVSLVILFFLIKKWYKKQFSSKRKIAQIKEEWGKPREVYRSFKLIGQYAAAYPTEKQISPATAADLDLERLFEYIDRTRSKPGQQYLYKKLHEQETNLTYFHNLEQRIAQLTSHADVHEQIELKLSELKSDNAYFLPELFNQKHKQLFGKFGQVYVSIAGISVITMLILLLLLQQQVYLLVLVALLIANTIIHYRNRFKIMPFTVSLPELLILNQVGQWLYQHNYLNSGNEVKQSLVKVNKLKRSISFINVQNLIAADPTDMFYLLTEWLKIFLLIEPLVFIFSISRVNKYLTDIRLLFESVAEVDMAISIQSFRDGLSYYCQPDFTASAEQLVMTKIYHPLVENCVPNSIQSRASQGVLITGSNMSGKTTFIRAVAINALLAQTLHTCCAQMYQVPMLHIHTSIQMSDDLHEHKSYFQAEALAVLDIIKQCEPQASTKSLVIIDEIFRGTNTIERIAAAKAVLSYLVANRNFVFVSTHDLELAELLGPNYAVYSFEEQIGDNRLIFDYQIKEGLLKNKNGIAVLEGAGYPSSIVQEAYQIGAQLREKYNL
ncbi:hypothetical protein HH214_14700 [Mucilaginibacter robiniae]|uniref:DNA mismatch repair proteins mutS family domain-containing protein n=1 Tax=Mucilaginibacter robiniae TaxID=2728022 RepID=A0A7L5E3P5_9SPHI|nr:hypothetical protein [Mucilaginibacter robiniae]QJD97027.1 hypothetical protein HH214_14700 [Mucilaginibacter robiniae]